MRMCETDADSDTDTDPDSEKRRPDLSGRPSIFCLLSSVFLLPSHLIEHPVICQ